MRVPGHDERGNTDHQALFCPYYVELEGMLGMNWGVIVNPRSPRCLRAAATLFGLAV